MSEEPFTDLAATDTGYIDEVLGYWYLTLVSSAEHLQLEMAKLAIYWIPDEREQIR